MKKNHKKCLECAHYKVHEVINGDKYNCDYIDTKICNYFDLSYLMLLKEDYPSKKFKVNELTITKERIVENSKSLQTKIRQFSFSNPKNSSEFKKLLKKFHETLLDKSKLKDIGKFRNVEIYFDTDKNRRCSV